MSHEAVTGHELAEISQQKSYIKLSGSDDATHAEISSQRTWPRLRNSLRLFRLQFFGLIFSRFTGWRSSTEHRKVALYHSRQVAASHVLLHVLPLSGAVTLLALQWTKYWIGTETSTSTFLQFAAKLHELMMQASLVEVLLCIIRTAAINGYVPLGTLSGVTQPTQLSYLWSLDFVSTFASPAFRGWRKGAVVLAIPSLLLLTSFVGPSSAILMIPRPDSPQIVQEVTLYAKYSMEDLSPSTLSGANGLETSLEDYNSTFRSPLAQELNPLNPFSESQKYLAELKVLLVNSSSNRVLLSSDESWGEGMIGNATIPSVFTARTFEYFHKPFSYVGTGNVTTSVTTWHPIVSSRCGKDQRFGTWPGKDRKDAAYDANITYVRDDAESLGVLFDVRTLVDRISNFSGSGSANMQYTNMTSFPSLWIPSPESDSHSLIGVFTMASWEGENLTEKPNLSLSWPSTQPVNDTTEYYVHFQVCTVSAYWNLGEIQLVKKFTSSDIRTGPLAISEPYNVKPITLDISNIDVMRTSEFTRALQESPWLSFHSMLSGFLVTAISNVPLFDHNVPVVELMPPNYDHNEKNESVFRYTTVQWGYGYGSRSTSVWLAMAVITTYCMITIAYIAYMLITGSTSTAWNSAIELVALALQSKRPDHLGNIGVGMDSIETFKEGVGIRVNRDNELELVFAHDRDIEGRGLRKIERNKEY